MTFIKANVLSIERINRVTLSHHFFDVLTPRLCSRLTFSSHKERSLSTVYYQEKLQAYSKMITLCISALSVLETNRSSITHYILYATVLHILILFKPPYFICIIHDWCSTCIISMFISAQNTLLVALYNLAVNVPGARCIT